MISAFSACFINDKRLPMWFYAIGVQIGFAAVLCIQHRAVYLYADNLI